MPPRATSPTCIFLRSLLALRIHSHHRFSSQFLPLRRISFFSAAAMPPRSPANKRWVEKPAEALAEGISSISLTDRAQSGEASSSGKKSVWMPKGYATASEAASSSATTAAVVPEKEEGSDKLTKILLRSNGEDFIVRNNTFGEAKIRATFYPKFENEKSDQEIRSRMIEMVSHGLATLEVSLKHSGSLFMYAGNEGGAYAKNSFGNIYTAVGVFVLGRMFRQVWGKEASKKQFEFNDFLERNRVCISMELVTAVLGDHGQRPKDDYVVVTAVTELGHGKPKFYSTPELITFCRKWRLPTNHIWLFSTRKSATAFFASYDALCEEGTATPVCKYLDEVADISVPGSKDHVEVQGEILEGLVARIVSRDSADQMKKVLEDFPPFVDHGDCDLGPSLRELCAANGEDEKAQIKALLESVGSSFCSNHSDWLGASDNGAHSRIADKSVLSKFLQAHPADYATMKLQEMIRLMRERHFSVSFKCHLNHQDLDSLSKDNLSYRMVIHVFSDHVFRRYQQEMRKNRGLWPLYRGFFVDVNLFKVNSEKAAELAKDSNSLLRNINSASDNKSSAPDGLADEDANLMVKLKFLTYKLRTFLIRNGLSTLFKEGPSAYKTYYLRQMKNWGTSASKQRELSKMLDEWAVHIQRKCGNKKLPESTYLSEAEPFLEQYAKRSSANQALIGSAGSLVRTENFLALLGDRDEEGDLRPSNESGSTSATTVDVIPKEEGIIVFFPGIPGCAKSALCKEIMSTPGGLGNNRPINSLMGDLIKGKYWQKVADERKKKPNTITLADKNAPNEEVWNQIEDMCSRTKSSAVPVIPESEGTKTNPFSLDALAVFIFRVLHRVNHPGNLDKASPNAGYVLLMFYNLYEGMNRKVFENEMCERFGSLVKMPLLKRDREPLPDPVKDILQEGLSLFRLHQNKHRRLEPSKGSYAKEWSFWEKRLREVLLGNSDYLNSIQVPFDLVVKQVVDQLREVTKGSHRGSRESEKRKFSNIIFAAVSLPASDVLTLLENMAQKDPNVKTFVEEKLRGNLKKAHVTLAHKGSHGVATVANYAIHIDQQVPVEFSALLFSDKTAALEAHLGSIGGEKVVCRNDWPHTTIWTAHGVPPKEANNLPELFSQGKATKIPIDPPFTISGTVQFY